MESKEVKIIKRNIQVEEMISNNILNEIDDLISKQNNILTRISLSDFIKKLNELNDDYNTSVIKRCTLDVALYGIEHSEE